MSTKMRRLWPRAKEVRKRRGILYVIFSGIRLLLDRLILHRFWLWYYCNFKPSTFTFQGDTCSYFYHIYNTTWNNERAVEIPIIRRILEEYEGKSVLEVGNVLSHYFRVNHDILDKYEEADGVINEDVVDFQPSKKYDLIVSISTLEHVGSDETPREPMKFLRAIENLKTLLVPGGKVVVTLPLGYNPQLDRFIREGGMNPSRCSCLRRVSRDNRWMEVDCDDIRNSRTGYPFRGVNGLIIATFGSNGNCRPRMCPELLVL